MGHIPLDEITLRQGAHDSRDEGVCLMEAAAWYAGEPHSDEPKCVCPVLAVFGRSLNDCLPDHKRIRLLPMVPRVVGTAGDGMAKRRGFLSADWLIRTYTPTWVRLAGLHDDALALTSLPEIVDARTTEGALSTLKAARENSLAAERAIMDNASEAAANIIRCAAWRAIDDSTWGAAWGAAEIVDAVWRDVWGAVYGAAGAVGAATKTVSPNMAMDALAPTVSELQDSAIELYTRMVNLRPAGHEVVVPERVLLPL